MLPAMLNSTGYLAGLVTMTTVATSRPGALPPMMESPTEAPTTLMIAAVVMVEVTMAATRAVPNATHGAN